MNTIPIGWQVLEVDTGDFELVSKTRIEEGIEYRWRKKKLKPAEKSALRYALRRRMFRSSVIRRGKHIAVVDQYQDISQDETGDFLVEIPFKNTSDSVIDDILIEDVIPRELIVRETISDDSSPILFPTPKSTIYRRVLQDISPGDTITTSYRMTKKPLTYYFIKDFKTEDKTVEIRIEKIVQPVVDVKLPQFYLWFNIASDIPCNVTIQDEIPPQYESIAESHPYYKPDVNPENTLSWDLKLTEKETNVNFTLKIQGTGEYNPKPPLISFEKIKIQEGEKLVRKEQEKMTIDFRTKVAKASEYTSVENERMG